MRIFLILTSILLLFIGIFGSALNQTPVEIQSGITKVDERKLTYVNGQNRISIKEIDSLTAFSNKHLANVLMKK